ncbi:putative short chain dehydrogenase/ reductase [Diaporthe sp. PMI_573]|nr:putative short chain dehydrogenase/ reductase [Diaporthaceae sp. PMI_573]
MPTTYPVNGKVAIVTGAGSGIGHALTKLLLSGGCSVAHLTSLWETTIKLFSRVNIVVSVAGVYEPPSSSFWNPPGISPESQDQPDISLSQYNTFAHQDIQGNYLAVASMAAYLHSVETPFYMASKAALISFVKSLGPLHDLFSTRVSAVYPGPVLGNGSIVEVQKIGEKSDSKITIRDLQMELLYPPGFAKPSKGVIRSKRSLIKHIQEFRMRSPS